MKIKILLTNCAKNKSWVLMSPAPLKCESYPYIRNQKEFLHSLRPGQLLSALFDAIPDVFYFVKDVDSRFMDASASFAGIIGAKSVEDLIGKTDYDFSPDFLAKAFMRDDRFVMGTGQAIRDKIELVPLADHSLDWLCTTKIPLFDRSNAIAGLAGCTRIIRDKDSVYAHHPEMRLIVDYVRRHYREKISTADMAREGGVSVRTQERIFRDLFGLTPFMYLQKTRLNAACSMLRRSGVDLATIATECGFNDQTNMTRAFRLELKITPFRYRQRFAGTKPVREGSGRLSALLSKA